MRYFWSFIVLLAVATGVLHGARRAGESRDDAPPDSAEPIATRTPSVEPVARHPARAEPEGVGALPTRPTTTEPSPQPVVAEAERVPEPTPEPVAEVAEEPAPEAVAQAAPQPAPTTLSLDALLGVVNEAAAQMKAEEPQASVARPVGDAPGAEPSATATAQGVSAGDATPSRVGPSFEVRADGSISVDGAGVITGDGSPQRPFLIDWSVLRSVSRDYNPKQGKDQVPDWVRVMDGKRVRVEGNTLVAVVSQATDELLVMQNPWDGCCVGIPPTPYDAIEVKLTSPQRLGVTATGFGSVEGVFKVDPYIVQGWLLGLYVINDAGFEAAAGITLPDL